MSYLDVYFSRINHMGETTGERIINGGIRSFQRWKNESPHTVTTLSVERGIYFDGIILSNKDKDYQKIMILNVANDIPIRVGDIMNWQQDNGDLEKWLLIAEEHKVHPTYRSFNIIKCNYLIKWINPKGYIKQSWAYVLSSVDNKVKGNFRTWHNLITPQPNKYAEIIMPRPVDNGSEIADTVDRSTTFIVEDEGWKMVEADFTSVNGIIYMSLTENKVNFQYDHLGAGTDDIADLDKYKFPNLPTLYKVGDTIAPEFETDTLNQWEIVLSKPDDCDFIDDNFVATGAGQCIITMSLKDVPAVSKKIEIIINEQETQPIYYIVGPDKVKLDRYATYSLKDEEGNKVLDNVKIEIPVDPDAKKPPSDYGTLQQVKDDLGQFINNEYVFHANDKNKLGQIVLVATYNGVEYTKTIDIIPLW